MVAEAEAVRDACFWCLRYGFLDAIIESDNASVIECCILIDRAPPWEIDLVVEDIRELYSRASLSFVAVRHSANRVADWLANFVRGFGSWVYYPCFSPPPLENLVRINMGNS